MPPGAHKISRAGEKGRIMGHQEGWGPNQLCGELPNISGE
jgi:hypothetical protein